MSLSIRRAHDSDVHVLTSMNRHVQELHARHRPDYFKQFDSDAVADWFRSMLTKPSVQGWIAARDAVDIGYAIAVVHERPDNAFLYARRLCEIDQIVVMPERRRSGVARALIDCVIADARARGIRDIELSSWAFNTEAHAAFRAAGFMPKIVRFGRASS
jgi:ribosomal protein S18 acetylase RimI-like enzyme